MSKHRIDPERLARMFKSLAHPHRLQIFINLAARRVEQLSCSEAEMAVCVGDIAEGLNIGPSTVSHHLKELREAGVIRMRRNGQLVQCAIDPSAVAAMREFFELKPPRRNHARS